MRSAVFEAAKISIVRMTTTAIVEMAREERYERKDDFLPVLNNRSRPNLNPKVANAKPMYQAKIIKESIQ